MLSVLIWLWLLTSLEVNRRSVFHSVNSILISLYIQKTQSQKTSHRGHGVTEDTEEEEKKNIFTTNRHEPKRTEEAVEFLFFSVKLRVPCVLCAMLFFRVPLSAL